MGVIPDVVNEGLWREYDADSALFRKYPELLPHRDHILDLIKYDRKIVEDTVGRGLLSSSKPVYKAVVGAPLAGKTTLLERYLADNPVLFKSGMYADPDQTGIPLMLNLYHRFLMSSLMKADKRGFEYVQRRAYDVARPASNIFTNDNINVAIANSINLAHGTTMTSPFAGNLLQSIKDNGYRIELSLVGAEDEMRAEGQQYRANEQGYYQSTPEDVRDKGLAFAERMGVYFTHADKLEVFWRDGVTEDATLAAVFENGQMQVIDAEAYQRFTNKYDENRVKLAQMKDKEGQPIRLPELEVHEAAYVRRFQGRDLFAAAQFPKYSQE